MAATRARFDIFDCTAREAVNIDPEWNYAIPYNSEDDRTCAEIMGNKQQAFCRPTTLTNWPFYVETAFRVFDNDKQSG